MGTSCYVILNITSPSDKQAFVFGPFSSSVFTSYGRCSDFDYPEEEYEDLLRELDFKAEELSSKVEELKERKLSEINFEDLAVVVRILEYFSKIVTDFRFFLFSVVRNFLESLSSEHRCQISLNVSSEYELKRVIAELEKEGYQIKKCEDMDCEDFSSLLEETTGN